MLNMDHVTNGSFLYELLREKSMHWALFFLITTLYSSGTYTDDIVLFSDLYLVDGGIVAENVTHWKHHAALSASLHDGCAVFSCCLSVLNVVRGKKEQIRAKGQWLNVKKSVPALLWY